MSRSLAAVLADFASVVGDQQTVSEILHRLAELQQEVVGVDGAGVLLRTEDGGLQFATASDELGRVIETLEAELGEGPCTDAVRRGEQIIVPDLCEWEQRYPRFAPAALERGIYSVHGLPMAQRGEPFGVVDLVHCAPRVLEPEDLAAAQLLTDVAASYIINSRAFAATSRLAQQLQHALDSRVVIEQAKGKLAEQLGTDVATAFEILRRYARAHNLKLHAVAEQLLSGELQLRRMR